MWDLVKRFIEVVSDETWKKLRETLRISFPYKPLCEFVIHRYFVSDLTTSVGRIFYCVEFSHFICEVSSTYLYCFHFDVARFEWSASLY